MGKSRDLADLGNNVGDVVSGSAKALVNFNGTGTVAIRDSLNVASITDNGTGNHDLNFSSGFANDEYCVAGSCGTVGVESGFITDLGNRTTGVFGIIPRTHAGSLFDFTRISATIHGDLA
jgi:hypothetical protein